MVNIRRKLKSIRAGVCVAALVFGGIAPVWAHHSTAAFDYTKVVSITGTVQEFFWTNPHMFIRLTKTEPDGSEVVYVIECGTPNVNVRHGWHRDDIQPGQKLQVDVAPMRDGSAAGTLIRATLPDGRVLYGPAVDVSGFGGPPGGPPGAPPPSAGPDAPPGAAPYAPPPAAPR